MAQACQLLLPAYGLWQAALDMLGVRKRGLALYGSSEESSARTVSAAGAFVGFAFLMVFVVLVPATQAFACADTATLGMASWVWGVLILFFWPTGLLWLLVRGGCTDDTSEKLLEVCRAMALKQ